MVFLALPEEQVASLVTAHRQVPMRAVARIFGHRAEPYIPVALEPAALTAVFQHAAVAEDPTVHLYLRDASLPGDFVWRLHPNPRRPPEIDFVRSSCAQIWVCVKFGDRLIAGASGVSGKGWYEDAGVDAAVPRKMKSFLDHNLRTLCPDRAAPPWTISSLERGEKTLRSVTNTLAHVSAGAMRFREEGGHWVDPHRGKLDWEYQPIDPTKYK